MAVRSYEIWGGGKLMAKFTGEIAAASQQAKGLAVRMKGATFVCRQKAEGLVQLIGFTSQKGKAVRLEKEQLPELFEMAQRKAARGGRPRKTQDGATNLSVSVDRTEKEKFDRYAERFAGGNRSEMFRRMFVSWEKMMETVVGAQT